MAGDFRLSNPLLPGHFPEFDRKLQKTFGEHDANDDDNSNYELLS
jgi:hypothetical protein